MPTWDQRTLFEDAIKNNDSAKICVLLQGNDAKELLLMKDDINKHLPVHDACCYNLDVSSLRLILETAVQHGIAKQVLEAKIHLGCNCLHLACWNSFSTDSLGVLFDYLFKYADIKKVLEDKTDDGWTCVDYACAYKMSPDSLQLLLDHLFKHADIKQVLEEKNKNDANCLHFASRYKLSTDALHLLLEYLSKHADIKKMLQAKNKFGWTWLHWACYDRLSIDSLRLLLEYSSNHAVIKKVLEEKNNNDFTCLDFACEENLCANKMPLDSLSLLLEYLFKHADIKKLVAEINISSREKALQAVTDYVVAVMNERDNTKKKLDNCQQQHASAQQHFSFFANRHMAAQEERFEHLVHENMNNLQVIFCIHTAKVLLHKHQELQNGIFTEFTTETQQLVARIATRGRQTTNIINKVVADFKCGDTKLRKLDNALKTLKNRRSHLGFSFEQSHINSIKLENLIGKIQTLMHSRTIALALVSDELGEKLHEEEAAARQNVEGLVSDFVKYLVVQDQQSVFAEELRNRSSLFAEEAACFCDLFDFIHTNLHQYFVAEVGNALMQSNTLVFGELHIGLHQILENQLFDDYEPAVRSVDDRISSSVPYLRSLEIDNPSVPAISRHLRVTLICFKIFEVSKFLGLTSVDLQEMGLDKTNRDAILDLVESEKGRARAHREAALQHQNAQLLEQNELMKTQNVTFMRTVAALESQLAELRRQKDWPSGKASSSVAAANANTNTSTHVTVDNIDSDGGETNTNSGESESIISRSGAGVTGLNKPPVQSDKGFTPTHQGTRTSVGAQSNYDLCEN